MIPFFATGLPRSRTAWVSNWLTCDKSICYHDPSAGDWMKLIAPYSLRRQGLCGSEVMFDYDIICERFSDARWALLIRNPAQAYESFKKIAKEHSDIQADTLRQNWKQRQETLALLQGKHNVRLVMVDELDIEDNARELWNYLLPGLDFDGARWRLLRDFNVQQKTEQVMKERFKWQ